MKTITTSIQLLTDYANKLAKAEKQEKKRTHKNYIGRVEAEGQLCRTIWLPVSETNRTATIDLNHIIEGFQNGLLFGENANCGMEYVIVDAPLSFNESHLDELEKVVSEKLGIHYSSQHRYLIASNANIVREAAYEIIGE